MAIPTTWKSVDDLPEWAKPLQESGDIVEKDGVLVLDVQGMRPKGDVDEFRKTNTALKKELEKFQSSMRGGLTPAEAAVQQRKLEELQERLDAGEDDERVTELMTKRLKAIEIDGREVNILRTDAPHVDHILTSLRKTNADLSTDRDALLGDLTEEKIVNGTHTAIAALGDVNTRSVRDVLRYVNSTWKMAKVDDKLIPVKPDLEASKDGDLIPVLNAEGKPLSIRDDLESIREGGETNWFVEPGGPRQKARPGTPLQGSQLSGVALIKRGLQKRAGQRV